ncbi:MAG: DUF1566 domain-containing protein [Treponema sp.]|jgi:hypothetical protein|nr:DUF1566 domain-containing protein [Treponema sp.]
MKKIFIFAVIVMTCSCANSAKNASVDSDYAQISSSSSQQDNSSFTAYSIGETGPAGGIIFYDKRSNSSGWRYLEAAPKEAEFAAAWSMNKTKVDKTNILIGSGKQNTEIIFNKFRTAEEEAGTAAVKAFNLEYNGFDDWFLPSQAELDQIYGNLKRRDIGDFADDMYWASNDADSEGFKTSVLNFSNGEMDFSAKDNIHYVRPIRQIPGPNPSAAASGKSSSGLGSGNAASVFKNSAFSTVIIGLAAAAVIVLMIFLPGNSPVEE